MDTLFFVTKGEYLDVAALVTYSHGFTRHYEVITHAAGKHGGIATRFHYFERQNSIKFQHQIFD